MDHSDDATAGLSLLLAAASHAVSECAEAVCTLHRRAAAAASSSAAALCEIVSQFSHVSRAFAREAAMAVHASDKAWEALLEEARVTAAQLQACAALLDEGDDPSPALLAAATALLDSVLDDAGCVRVCVCVCPKGQC